MGSLIPRATAGRGRLKCGGGLKCSAAGWNALTTNPVRKFVAALARMSTASYGRGLSAAKRKYFAT
jgi:hypothetical protein